MGSALKSLAQKIASCNLCAERFAATHSRHTPRPISHLSEKARILIASQAPGARAHASGIFFDDPSGDRLRAWLGVDRATFYAPHSLAIVPMGFCFPGYDAKGSDLPPPPTCAPTWRSDVLAALPGIELTLLIGGYSQRWHLGREATRGGVTQTVAAFNDPSAATLCLPHPSWRNTSWLKKNPWFEADVVPGLQARVRALLALPGTGETGTPTP